MLPGSHTPLVGSSTNCSKWIGVLCLLIIVSCSSNTIQPGPKQRPTQAIELEKKWSTYVGFGSSHRNFRYNIAANEETLFVTGKQGRLYAIDKNSGSRRWYYEFDIPVTAGVTLQDGVALMANEEGEVLAFNISTKTILWRTSLQSELLHSPVTNGAAVIAQLNNGSIHAIDINNGDILWSAVTENPSLTQRGVASPLLVDNLVIAGFATGRLLIFSLTSGQRIWQSDVGIPTGINEIGRLVDLDGQFYFDGTTVYGSALHGDLIALDLIGTQPTERWRRRFSNGSGITGYNGNIYAISEKGIISAFNSNTGALIWRNQTMPNYQYNAPVIWQGYLTIADQLGYINLIDLATGALAGLYRNSPYSIQSNFLSQENTLYVLDIGGFLSALHLDQ